MPTENKGFTESEYPLAGDFSLPHCQRCDAEMRLVIQQSSVHAREVWECTTQCCPSQRFEFVKLAISMPPKQLQTCPVCRNMPYNEDNENGHCNQCLAWAHAADTELGPYVC